MRIFTTYNSDLSVSEVMGAWKRYEPKAVNDEVLLCYGYGDGGGGPTRAMIERGIRLERGIPGAPKVKLEGIVPFLDRLGAKMDADRMALPRLERRALPAIPPRHADQRRQEQGQQPQVRAAAARARIPERHGDARGRPLPRRKAQRILGAGSHQPVPRHPARHLDRRGLCRQRRRVREPVLDPRVGQRPVAHRRPRSRPGRRAAAALQLHRP